ncbi:GGDEF domain-containing protein [Bacillus sp. FJAT-45350]|uniref:GGDEF domain-containing protein n=1 Tax=Bacillus sp. FJAT-45350 TaxID=2011014 RepID=UPI0015C800E4|nr:GGDEF domain-containing protein [Bacillus sp. FJAT-45350]
MKRQKQKRYFKGLEIKQSMLDSKNYLHSNKEDLLEFIEHLIGERNSLVDILEYVNSGVMVTNPSQPDNPIIYVNDEFLNIVGYKLEEVLGQNPRFLQGEETDKEKTSRIKKAIDNNEPIKEEVINYRKDGTKFWNEVNISQVYDQFDNLSYHVGLIQDITKRKETEAELELATLVFDNMEEIIIVIDDEGQLQYVNDAFERITGYSQQEIEGKHIKLFGTRRHPKTFYTNIWNQVVQGGRWQGELSIQVKSGKEILLSSQFRAIYDESKQVTKYMSVSTDITGKKESEERIKFLAYHDSLTSLPNREKFKMELTNSLENDRTCAIIFFDLDHFKQVNDTLGHHAGDLLLKEVAKRIENEISDIGMVARMGGDEFTILMPNQSEEVVREKASRIIKKIQSPFSIMKRNVELTTSMGISVFPDDGNDVISLMKKADQAMYHAKHAGRNQYCFWREVDE